MPYTHLLNVTSDLGSGFDRIRVDVGQTGFFEGREFRSYFEFSSDVVPSTAIAVGGTRTFKFTSPVDFVLQSQIVEVDKGGVRVRAFINATDGGGWTSVPVIAKNRSPKRRQFNTGYYVGQATVSTGGTFTGGTEVDVLRARTASQTVAAANVGSAQDDERYLPAGSYFIIVQPLAGVNDTSEGIYSISWEERP